MLLDIGAENVSRLPTNPLPTTPRDAWETWGMSVEEDRATQSSDSRTRNHSAAYDRAADELRRFGGTWNNPVGTPSIPAPLDTSSEDAIRDSIYRSREEWRQQVETLSGSNPGVDFGRFMPEAIEAEADRLAVQSVRDYAAVVAVQGATVAGTLGGLYAAITDPLNIATMPLGAGRMAGGVALRILKTAGVEAAIGGASQAAVDAYAAPYRVSIGLPADVGSNILMGALGGAIVGGGVRGSIEAWRYFRSTNPPADGGVALREADAATVAETLRRENITNPASVAQAEMHLERLDRATSAVATGRIAEDASLLIPPGMRSAELAGDSLRVFTPTGRAVEVQPQVVELADLIPSHTDDFALNPAYPHSEGVQPRDRSRDASVNQVQQIAGNLEPDRLRPSPEAGNGAPIIDSENVVESGNGRVLALRQVYGDPANAARADAYRAMLTAAGHDVEGFAAPVLVSRRVSALAPDERRAFVREANAETSLGLSAAEQARVDAEQVGRIIDLYRGGDVASAENAGFVRGFMRGLPQTAQGRMVGPDGGLSSEGARRLRGAVLARAYGDEMGTLLERITEGDAEGLKSIAGALQDVSARWAAMRAAVSAGEIAPAMDTTADLFGAVNVVSLARQKRMPVADVLAQSDFDVPPLSDTGRAMLATMYRDPQLRGAAGRDAIATRLNGYLDEAMQTRPEPDLFGAPAPTPAQVMEATDPMRGRQSSAAAAGERQAEIAELPKVPDAEVLEAQRIAAQQDVMVPDANGEPRSLRDQLDEADSAIADAAGAAACFIGAAAT